MLKIIFAVLILIITIFWRKLFRNPYGEKRLLNKVTPMEFVEKYTSNSFYLPCANLKLYGKELSKVFDDWHRFEKSAWYLESKTLEIHFNENVILRIINPSDIEERIDRIVIWNAERINWEWSYLSNVEPENVPYSFEIINSNKTLELKDPRGLISGNLKNILNGQPAIELIE